MYSDRFTGKEYIILLVAPRSVYIFGRILHLNICFVYNKGTIYLEAIKDIGNIYFFRLWLLRPQKNVYFKSIQKNSIMYDR